ncbi:MAG: hypothetical protein MJ152_05010 [Clostridia bacterium]|nr:hypothetical protein [Clostridia bacterium]
MFAFDKRDKDEETIKAIDKERESLKLKDEELKIYMKYEKKTRKNISSTQFGLFAGAVVLIIMGIVVMI